MNAFHPALALRSLSLAAIAALAVAGAVPAFALSQARKVGPEHLSSYWILLNTKVDADVPNSGQNLNKPVCVAVAYDIGLVGEMGKAMNPAVVKVVPQSDLSSAALSMVKRFEYGPALNNSAKKEPVSTYWWASTCRRTRPRRRRSPTPAACPATTRPDPAFRGLRGMPAPASSGGGAILRVDPAIIAAFRLGRPATGRSPSQRGQRPYRVPRSRHEHRRS